MSAERRILEGWTIIADYVEARSGLPFPRSAAIYAEAVFKLPVRRLLKRQRVFAYSDEIDRWLQGQPTLQR